MHGGILCVRVGGVGEVGEVSEWGWGMGDYGVRPGRKTVAWVRP